MAYYFDTNVLKSFIVLAATVIFVLTTHMWCSYILYELSMIPMLLIIIGGGLNPYRFNAFYFMLVYSLVFSLPTMVVFTIMMKLNLIMDIFILNFYEANLFYNIIFIMFLVKTPVYLLHFWLPKAHVEASTLGSVVLASVMLKLGAVGCLKMSVWCKCDMMLNKTYFVLSLIIVSFCCLIQSDFKKLVALTSVVHMMMGVSLILNSSGANFKAFLIINISHTLGSCLMFYFSGIVFKLSHSRLIYLQSMIKFNTSFTLVSVLVMLNLGVPPFYPFLGELMYFSHVIIENVSFFIMSMVLVMLITFYSLMLMNNMKSVGSLKINFNSLLMYIFIVAIMVMLWLMIWV